MLCAAPVVSLPTTHLRIEDSGASNFTWPTGNEEPGRLPGRPDVDVLVAYAVNFKQKSSLEYLLTVIKPTYQREW